MHRHIDFTFESKYPFLTNIGGYGKAVYVLDLWKVGLTLNGNQIADIMERLCHIIQFNYWDGRVYDIRTEGNKIIIESKF